MRIMEIIDRRFGRQCGGAVTPEIAEHIRLFAKVHPGKTHVEIARQFNISPGRVSSVLRAGR